MAQAIVLDAEGKRLSPTSEARARRLVGEGRAVVVREDPLTVQLDYQVRLSPRAGPTPPPGKGQRLLLHICCAPCSTYSVERLRQLGFDVTGCWYNPNVHPFGEHERRREALAQYAAQIELPMVWQAGYEILDFMRTIHGRERYRVRCHLCYEMRMERTVQVAAQGGYDVFTTTLLISPYQDQDALKAIGEQAAARHGIGFFFENLRRGWAERGRITRECELYSQRYCGCIYSEWESLDRGATTRSWET
jgi:predicted adenine nucleotide alpha hydrolase (AANH) superfamily ATPase